MRLFEIYQEGNQSEFIHDGKTYDLNKLFKLTAQIEPEQYRVSDMTWLLKYDLPQPANYDQINIEAPLLITMWFEKSVDAWRHVVIDGIHRLFVAKTNRVSHLPGIMVPEDILAKCII